MNIKNLEYIAPTQANPLGSLQLNVEIPVIFKDGMKPITEKEDAEVELSAETVELLQKVAASIIADLTK